MRRAQPATTRPRWRRRAATAVASAVVLIGSQLAFPAGPAAAVDYGVINNNPAFIQFYANNVENLPRADDKCHGDWLDLVMYMKTYSLSPDIYLVQQISGQEQIDNLAARMEKELKGSFRGIAAVANPTVDPVACGAPKAKQTTGIIYRPGRFTVVNQTRWRANYWNGTKCVNETKDRSAALGIRFYDTIAKKHVSVSTVHFPTMTTGDKCIDHNITESGAETATLGATNLSVWGGDLNNHDQSAGKVFTPWYNKVNGDRGGALGWRDAIYDACRRANPADITNCTYDRNWTIAGENRLRRIDFLFAKLPGGALPRTDAGRTITFDEGDAADKAVTTTDREDRDYSDHRAIRSRIYYTAG
ncbi:hypothetical protein [Micromonospora sp. KLBMP9576]|uniref:hypothetical protein n=1 Tax=Micromonospora sp. KLBMP9576 TaxID=3424769 RepID=UPI003D8BA1FD